MDADEWKFGIKAHTGDRYTSARSSQSGNVYTPTSPNAGVRAAAAAADIATPPTSLKQVQNTPATTRQHDTYLSYCSYFDLNI
jgi:hypothetical protein